MVVEHLLIKWTFSQIVLIIIDTQKPSSKLGVLDSKFELYIFVLLTRLTKNDSYQVIFKISKSYNVILTFRS